jgi:hypothetical protein
MIRSRGVRWMGHVAHMEEMSSSYRVLFGKLEGRRPVGRPTYIWEDVLKWILTLLLSPNSAAGLTTSLAICHSTLMVFSIS